MAEDAQTNLADLLENIYGKTSFTKKARSDLLKSVNALFDNGKNVPVKEAERIINICLNDENNLVYSVTFIKYVLNNEEAIKSVSKVTLKASAEYILKLYITMCQTNATLVNIKAMTLQTFLLHPKEILTEIIKERPDEYISIIELNVNNILEACKLMKPINALPSEVALSFVENNITFWFSKFLPKAIENVGQSIVENEVLEAIELLTEILIKVDYFETNSWKLFLENVCDVNKYPTIVKKMLENRSNMWHRLWIVLIKLLNNNITKSIGTFGTPINSLLPVVETAFKKESKQRCRAFECWDDLITNFSKETNENCLAKRVRLLIIPFRLNNAKTEEIADAKLKTWWHFVLKFESKLDKFSNDILIPFIHFMYGRHGASKPTLTDLSPVMNKKCIEVLVEIIGHCNCNCKRNIPKPKNKILSLKMLVDNWNDWLYSITIAIRSTMSDAVFDEDKKSYICCMWRSLALLIGEMPGNAVRQDLFNEMIKILSKLSGGPDVLPYQPAVIFILVTSLCIDEKTTDLMKSKNLDYMPLSKIISVITNPNMDGYYKTFTAEELITNFKPIAHQILYDITHTKQLYFNSLSASNSSFKLWTAIAETLCETGTDINKQALYELMKWPLTLDVTKFRDVKRSAMVWYTIYNLMFNKLKDTGLDKLVLSSLSGSTIQIVEFRYFYTCVLLGILKHKILNEESHETFIAGLQNLISKFCDYKDIDDIVPILVDVLVVAINFVSNQINEVLAESVLMCVKYVINLIVLGMDSNSECKQTTDTLLKLFRNLLQPVKPLFKIKTYSTVTPIILKSLITEQRCINNKDNPLFDQITVTLKSLVDENTIKKITAELGLHVQSAEVIKDKTGTTNEFNTPEIKKVKKTKKGEPNIVNKVVENGEEYVVVKSNWRFNPKTLTENQKEKFQKKREDIPALYQDLSQSQDEFKLKAWKPDSQDTSLSNTNSKSVSNDNVSELNKLPTEVVPNIIGNMLNDSDSKSPQKNVEKSKAKKVESPVTPKNTKSPRMALKDRVFRNMKNLLEKSTSPKGTTANNNTEVQNQVENQPNTPKTKPSNDAKVVNSAPPLLAADRPSRLKRKPKKFDDSELFALRKRRHSQADSQTSSHSDSEPQVLPPDPVPVIEVDNTPNNITETEKPVNIADKESTAHTTGEKKSTESKSQDAKEADETKCDDMEIDKAKDDVSHNNDKPEPEAVNISAKNATNKDIEPVVEPTNVTENKSKTSNETAKNSNSDNTVKAPVTPLAKTKELSQSKSTTKKSGKKSRIEKELAIDTVEGHPLLKNQSEKRSTRKKLIDSEKSSRRKCVAEKLNKSKTDVLATPKTSKKGKGKKVSPTAESKSVIVSETQEKANSQESNVNDEPCSEDVIESSQDSSVTAISVISGKRTPNRLVVALEKLKVIPTVENRTQDLLQDSDMIEMSNKCDNNCSKDDIELPQNKTADELKNQTANLTENMDTQPVEDTDEIIIINDDEIPITINSEPMQNVGFETQELAEADTQPNPDEFMEIESSQTELTVQKQHNKTIEKANDITLNKVLETSTENQMRIVSVDLTTEIDNANEISSPFKDDDQRKQDFLNNTLEISPIKIQSPDRERDKKSPSPETSSDYVVIQLSSPVQSNGEPFEKVGSPEFFTDDKISPDKMNASPPRVETSVNNTSPSTSLSLKKNRPQVRSGGRAAQMLGLCMPDNTINIERSETEEIKKTNTSTPARRNLRILYNSVGENNENAETEESESFLKLKRTLPSVDSSPSGPILKRKLVDITDETTASPASKRKRVSFHDPPVSTTVSVQKYIEPCGVRSPQHSAQKRLERQMRQPYSKSPKRLDNAFKLVSVLAKTAESFTEAELSTQVDDTPISLDVTPAIEIVKNSDLNDTDPICPALLDCGDLIDVIASELSSPAMKDLLVKELEGKIKTVGDLAKMTELEVNRLCIKAPKVQIAKKVLDDYARNLVPKVDIAVVLDEEVVICQSSVEMQTDEVLCSSIEVQTVPEPGSMNSTQTDIVSTNDTSIQTDESGSRSTSDIITSCILERGDFIEKLSEHLKEDSIKQIAEKLPTTHLTEIVMNKSDKSTTLLDKILEDYSSNEPSERKKEKELSSVRDYLCNRFESKDLVLFCSQLLQKAYEKQT